ncbi:hypothetical protein [Microbacterium sp. GXF0217]
MQPDPRSNEADLTVQLINRTLALHRRQVAVLIQSAHPSRVQDPEFDALQIQRQATYLRIVSATEAFCAERLVELGETKINPSENQLRREIWEQAAINATANWDAIQRALKDWHDARPSWADVNRIAEVRNAIAHGLGTLTRRQRSKQQSTTRIRESGVRLKGIRLELEESDLERAAGICITLVGEVDVQTK